MSEIIKLKDIKPDAHNANAHTERGEYMLRKSMGKFGFLEAGLLDADNNIIGGNHRAEVAADVLAAEDAVVIDVDGTQPVFIRRRDLRLDTPEGREAAIALNRTAQVGIEWDADAIAEGIEDGVNLDDWFREDELEDIAAVHDLEMTEPSDRRELGDTKRQIKAVIYSDQVDILERAILATGEQNRGRALIQICEEYLDAAGQFDFQI